MLPLESPGVNVIDPSFHASARTVVFLIYPGFQLLDLSGPLAAFQLTAMVTTPPAYRIAVVSQRGGFVRSTSGVEVSSRPLRGMPVDTMVVVGGAGVHQVDESGVALVRRLSGRARRTTSVCTGAFLLARAGLLDGRRATTHWRHAAALQRAFPKVRVDADRIFIQEGSVWTSAGIAAGVDLALALIEQDLGMAASKAVARELVVAHRRAGGQSQHSEMLALEPESDRIRRALDYARGHLREPLTVERLAEVSCLSLRQFNRSFREQTGDTPAKAIERLRIEAAKPRVESSAEPIEAIAESVGFRDPERMRRAFLRRFGHPPQAIRRAAAVG